MRIELHTYPAMIPGTEQTGFVCEMFEDGKYARLAHGLTRADAMHHALPGSWSGQIVGTDHRRLTPPTPTTVA